MGLEAATLMAIGTGVSTAATFMAADGTKQVGRYNKQIADRNAKVAEQKQKWLCLMHLGMLLNLGMILED